MAATRSSRVKRRAAALALVLALAALPGTAGAQVEVYVLAIHPEPGVEYAAGW